MSGSLSTYSVKRLSITSGNKQKLSTEIRKRHTLEDAYVVNLHLLAQSDEMAQGVAQLVQYCDAVGALQRCLLLDEVRQLSRGDMLLVIHCLGIELAVTQ